MSATGFLPLRAGDAAWRWIDAGGANDARPPRTDVRRILDTVREGGDAALLDLAARFDGGRPAALRVPPERCREALAALDPDRRAALELARDNIARCHEAQRRVEPPLEVSPGVTAWREFRPIRRVGVYVPGGRAAYPSSLLMSAVPARIAGCAEVVACSPAGPSGWPADAVLAAAALADVDELYAVGGAHAIAALAYGTGTIAPVDKIFGPGGGWVNEAKLAVFDTVAIDLPAGPSEVVVWADGAADPDNLAAELVAQAEHGPDSRCALVLSGGDATTLSAVADRVRDRAAARVAALPRDPADAATTSLRAGIVVVFDSHGPAAEWIDAAAPEHLAIRTADPAARLADVSTAGAVFLGPWSPVAAGDYCSGTNHVLPTGGRGRGVGGLDLDAFGRWISVQRLTREGLETLRPAIETLAEWEGLPAHAASAGAPLANTGASLPSGGDR